MIGKDLERKRLKYFGALLEEPAVDKGAAMGIRAAFLREGALLAAALRPRVSWEEETPVTSDWAAA